MGDLDYDSWLDFYIGTGDPNLRALMPNRMFRNVSGERFEEVTASGGFGSFAERPMAWRLEILIMMVTRISIRSWACIRG